MKTSIPTYTRNRLLGIVAALGMTVTAPGEENSVPPQIAIHLIDDVSGTELAKHGIVPADYEGIQKITDIVFARRASGSFSYDVIDQDGGDNQSLRFSITPFAEEVPQRLVTPGMTVREKQIALKEFEENKRGFIAKHKVWNSEVIDGVKLWIDECVDHRVEIEEDFLRMIRANQNLDLRRSDIIGSVQQGNAILADAPTRYLILNTDMVHQPGETAREQKSRPLNHADIAAQVVIVLVNTSGEPNRSPLLKGLPNRILRAESLADAAKVILADLDHS